ncbi:MAG: hypothetical protein Q7J08_01105 [Methanocorpusculum sp.]|uniref:hypothetical protein n=1 Tax=Methanocorpusculum sp. TaxID=2058474 RepID=UPI002723CB1B|nr:hypothetical protein [Methanocorpusculum sp.]MDO9522293.1 hypothetical protein [Methanocorpusculum sp.]
MDENVLCEKEKDKLPAGLYDWVFLGGVDVSRFGVLDSLGLYNSSHEIHENMTKTRKREKFVGRSPFSTLPRPPTPKSTKLNEIHEKGDRGGEMGDIEAKVLEG